MVGGSLDERFDLAQPGRYDTTTYEEIFGMLRWYAATIGDVRLMVLFYNSGAAPVRLGMVRSAASAEATTYPRRTSPMRGHGQHIFAPISTGKESSTRGWRTSSRGRGGAAAAVQGR